MLQPILKDNLDKVAVLCKEHQVEKLYAFGSVCTDKFNDESDVDFVYRFSNNISLEAYADNFFDFLFKLQALFKREVDLVSEEYLSNPHFIKVMNRTKTPIYG
jgi:predicted nucleotidyltransferase